MDPLQSTPTEDSLVASRLGHVRSQKPTTWTRRGLEETDDEVARPVSHRGTNKETGYTLSTGPTHEATMDEITTPSGVSLSPTIPLPMEDFSSYAKKHSVLGQDVTGGDEEPPILAVSKNLATPVVDAADMNDAFDPKSPRAVLDHVPNETPNSLNDTVASADECDDGEEYTIQNRWLRVAVPLMMTPFSVGGIYLCLYAFGPCSSSLVCNMQRSRAVLGSIMVVIPQALVQLIALTAGGKQWGCWCSFTAGLLFEGAGLLISLLVALSTPTFDVIGDWLLAVSVQSISWYFSTWATCVRAKKRSTGRKTRESDVFLNRKGNGDCLGFIAACFTHVVNVTAARVRATNNTTTTDADFVGVIFFLIGNSAVGILSSCAVCACCYVVCCREDEAIHEFCCGCDHLEEEDNGKQRGAPASNRLIWHASPLLLIEVPALLRAGSREGAGMIFAYSLMMIYSLSSLVIDCGTWSVFCKWSVFRKQVTESHGSPLDSDEIDEEAGHSNIDDGKSYSKIEVITLPTGRLGVFFKGNKRSPAKASRFESFSPLVGVLEEGKEVVSLYIPGDELHTNANSARLGKLLADLSHIANRELTACCKSANDEEMMGVTEARKNEKEYEKNDTKPETVTLPIGRLGVYFVGNKKSGVKISRIDSSSPLVRALGEGTEFVSLYVPGDKLYSNIGSLRLGKALSESSNVVNRKLKVRKRYEQTFASTVEDKPIDSDGGDSELSC